MLNAIQDICYVKDLWCLRTSGNHCDLLIVDTKLFNIFEQRAITHDSKVYPEPDTFNPERFLGADPAPDPRTYVFGVGRRICPGRDFAEASIFTTVSMLLATSTLTKAIDENGKEIEAEFITTGNFGK
jgi:hypothetical protein